MLSFAFSYYYAECFYDECRYVECRYGECRGADRRASRRNDKPTEWPCTRADWSMVGKLAKVFAEIRGNKNLTHLWSQRHKLIL